MAYRVSIHFPDGDGAADNQYEPDVLPRVGEHVKGLNNRFYRVLAVIHRVNDPEDMADYELVIKREELPNPEA